MPKTKKTTKKPIRTIKPKAQKPLATATTSQTALPNIDRSKLIFLVALVVIAVAGVVMLVPKQAAPSSTATALQHTVTYRGEDGKNALDLLKAHHQVAAQQFSIGSFVTAIDGISAPPNYFWAFSANGKPSDVGADQFITKNSDTLSWHLERIQ